MATTEEIIVKFRTEGGREVEETFARAGDAGEKFHSTVTKTSSGLEDLRLKSEARVARNIGQIAQSMTSGASAADILAQSITSVTESFRGSLLFAGAATVGVALYKGITQAGEAVINLDRDIAQLKSRTLVSGDFIGADVASKNLEDVRDKFTALVTQLRQEEKGGATGGAQRLTRTLGQIAAEVGSGNFGEAYRVLAQSYLPNLPGRPGSRMSVDDEKKLNDLRIAGADALTQQATQQATINEQLQETLSGDETRVAVLAETDRYNKRIAEIAGVEALLGLKSSDARTEEEKKHALILGELQKQASIEQTQLELQGKIADAGKELLPPAERNLEILNLTIDALNKILAGTLSIQERERYGNQLRQSEAAREQTQQGLFEQGPFRFEQEGIRARRNRLLRQQARDRFQQEELQRRVFGTPDVRSPGLRAYEEATFGPFQAPQTEIQQRVAYGQQQQEETRQYLADQARQFRDYNALMYPPSGAPGLPYGTNVNTGENQLAVNAIAAIKELLDPVHTLLDTLNLLPSMVGVN